MQLAALPDHVDVAIIGSGFSGLAMAQRLLRTGRKDFVLLERGDDVGGTWRDNSYPGCACDVPSHLYSFSFAPNPDWTRSFSAQPEIYEYLRKVADEQGIRPHVRLGAEVTGAQWDAGEHLWRIETGRGSLTARVLVAAPGALSDAKLPPVPGLDTFEGHAFHSSKWDHDHDLTGERVAVIGTGASAIQFVPQIQPKVGELHLFQRTPPWIMPRADRPIPGAMKAALRHVPGLKTTWRGVLYGVREAMALPLVNAQLAPATRVVAEAHLRRSVPDAALRDKLRPDYQPGCKRILISNDYLPSLTKPNVEVHTAGLQEVRGSTVVGTDGTEREVDTIIFGTGFQVQELPIAGKLRDGEGRSLREHWGTSMWAHRGTSVPGFPNLFLLLGPNTGLGHTSVVIMAEAQADYVLAAIEQMDRKGVRAVEARQEALDKWAKSIDERMEGTIWVKGGCTSWYLDDTGRNSTLWPGFTLDFRARLRSFDAGSYTTIAAPAPAAEVAA